MPPSPTPRSGKTSVFVCRFNEFLTVIAEYFLDDNSSAAHISFMSKKREIDGPVSVLLDMPGEPRLNSLHLFETPAGHQTVLRWDGEYFTADGRFMSPIHLADGGFIYLGPQEAPAETQRLLETLP